MPLIRLALPLLLALAAQAADPWLVFEGGKGPGKGKHVVLVSGDEEYRSEEAMPQLAQILANRHGFRCTVLFAIDPDGSVNPERRDNIPGLAAVDKADLLILFTRFRDLPDDQMKHLYDYIESGRPIVALRTATHAFDIKNSPTYKAWTWNSKDPQGGFGRLVLGETWVSHHGQHGKQSTRGLIAPGQEKHPILRGIPSGAIWGPTDVYTARPPADATLLVMGQVLTGMKQDDAPAEGNQNEPMMPIAWTRTYKGGRIFTTTMGSSQDLQNEGFRRLVVNASYWALGMEKKMPARADVTLVGNYQANPFGFGKQRRGLKPEDYK